MNQWGGIEIERAGVKHWDNSTNGLQSTAGYLNALIRTYRSRAAQKEIKH